MHSKRRRRRRFWAGFLCFVICFSMNASPVATICGAIANSGLVDRFVSLKNNLLYVAETGNDLYTVYADDADCNCSCTVSIDLSKVEALLGNIDEDGVGIWSTVSSISDDTEDIASDTSYIKADTAKILTSMTSEFEIINGYFDDVIARQDLTNAWLSNIYSELVVIQNTIQAMQHNYKVAHAYSLNNMVSSVLWTPTSDDIPYAEDLIICLDGFANVYMGYWDTAVQTLYNPGNQVTTRAQEVLGYDVLVRAEGMVLTTGIDQQTATDGLSGKNTYYELSKSNKFSTSMITYYQQLIPEDNITWLDAVTVLYKALGEEQLSYQAFSSYNSGITPESSPAYQGLSNPTATDLNGDGVPEYNGWDVYTFFSRSNIISATLQNYGDTTKVEEALADTSQIEINYLYWAKAINGGFIPSDYASDPLQPITFSDFFILASKMMKAYGEPVMNDSELKALLQVYGTHYPIQLGTEIADAWAYLACRGILDFSEFIEGEESILYDIVYTGYISRDQLLTMCTRIADEDSRTDYKEIQIVLDLSDVMQEDYYYPVYDLSFTDGQFSVTTEYDHKSATCYDYLLLKNANTTLGTVGTPMVYSDEACSSTLSGASVDSSTITTSDGNEYYHVKIPKTYTGNAYVAMHVEGSATISQQAVTKIVIPSSVLGGGYYTGFNISNGIATVYVDSTHYLLFDRKSEYVTRNMTDYARAEESKPSGSTTAYNSTTLEWLSAKVDEWTSPATVYAAGSVTNTTGDAVSTKITYVGTSDSYSQIYLSSSEVTTPESTNTGLQLLGMSDYADDLFKIGDVTYSGAKESTDFYIPYATAQDVLLLNRLATIYEFSSAYSQLHGTIATSIRDFYSCNNSVLDSFKYGIKHSSTDMDDVAEGDYVSAWSGLHNAANYDKKVSSSYINKYADFAFIQFLFGLNANAVTVVASSTTAHPKASSVDTYKLSTIKGDLYDIVDDYFTTAQDDILVDVLSRDITGVFQSSISTYTISGTEDACNYVKEILGSDEIANSGSSANSTTEDVSLDTNVATTTIMNRDEQILISWTDLFNSGYIVKTGEVAADIQPTQQTDGSYRFFTLEGQVIVNDVNHTIQIGNTLYDLVDSQGEAPTLVYIDVEQDNEMYLDYRCVMGVVASRFTIDEGVTKTIQNNLGVGNTVVYELSNNGITDDYFGTIAMNCYTFGSSSSSGSSLLDSTYVINVINTTQYDGLTYTRTLEDLDADGNVTGTTTQDITYWDSGDRTRLRLSAFNPLANYMVLINYDGQDQPKGTLYVYYLRTAFEYGYYEDGTLYSGVDCPFSSEDQETLWGDWATVVADASVTHSANGGSSFKDTIYNIYSIVDGTEPEWYIKMSCVALSELYEATGTYYISEDYVVRSFDITNCSITNAISYINQESDSASERLLDPNEPGAIYWMDNIGFVYNMPTVEEFSYTKYLRGEYLLPIATMGADGGNPRLVNYNVNYYGNTMNSGVASGTSNGVELPYGVVLSPDSDSPYIYKSGGSSAAYNAGTVSTTTVDSSISNNQTRTTLLPFLTTNAAAIAVSNFATATANNTRVNCFTPAPSGIYAYFFRNNDTEDMTVGDLTQYITNSTKVFVGTTRVTFNSNDSQNSTVLLNYASTEYNPVGYSVTTGIDRVYRSSKYGDVIIIRPANLLYTASANTGEVTTGDTVTSELMDWLAGLGSNDLITAIDTGASWLIVFAFNILPMIGIIFMTILVGLSFISEIKVVQILFDRLIDPIKLLTFGVKDVHTWTWRKVLVPCILMYIVFALFLNGNIIRIIMWGAEWYGTIMKWAKNL